MNDHLAFLHAIRTHPADNTARLVFADWLDERDNPLGGFIRLQIELEPIRYRIDDPHALELHKREEELLHGHGDEWMTTNDLLGNHSDFGPVFRRGFPDHACLSLDTFLQNGEAIFAEYPTLREVALYGVANRCAELTLSPLLGHLETLEIADWPTADDAAALSVSPHLESISRFKLWVGELSFFHQLLRQANANWPHAIELVQVYGGRACLSPDIARETDEITNRLVSEANEQLGRPLVRVTRPFAQLFPIAGDTGRNICAGHLPDGRPALAAGSFRNWILVVFTDDGRVQTVDVRDSPIRASGNGRQYGEERSRLDLAFEEWVEGQLQLELGLIWVREFRVEDLAVELWPDYLRDRIANPYPEPPGNWTEEEWRSHSGVARGWLEQRNFVINWGTDYWADWRGIIHSS